ncbi:hypothetical protein PIB30_029665 [Stylosanthes scabra]|uniref:Uncharacterized protein n=1 Tax=Stylosanthes scabra TaxID=79078 RepID=A0ABU6TBL1_9FABA|nr:hypothetical protein [Stylosanthes scabra]
MPIGEERRELQLRGRGGTSERGEAKLDSSDCACFPGDSAWKPFLLLEEHNRDGSGEYNRKLVRFRESTRNSNYLGCGWLRFGYSSWILFMIVSNPFFLV